MKQLLLVRHAKSSWSEIGLEDKMRPLNNRGLRDGPYMASHCKEQGFSISHLISSPAVRAFSTAMFFNEAYKTDGVELSKESDLYFGSLEDWMHIINELDDKSCVFPAFFSHNPNITYFANSFVGSNIENVPTCGIIHLESSVDKWSALHYDNTHIKGVYFPKALLHGKKY